MNLFFERYNVTKYIQEKKTDNLNTFICIKESESVNNLPKQKSSGPDRSTGKLYQTFKEDISILYK